MKRMLAMLLAMLMVLSLVGCGAPSSEEMSEESLSNEITEPDSTEEEEDPIAVKIEELLAEGDFEKICTEIVTTEELLRLFYTAGIREGHGDTIDHAFEERFLRPDIIFEMSCRILEKDYEEVGIISTSPYYHFFYVMQDGVYTVYDVLSTLISGNIYPESFESKDAMLEYAIAKRGDSDGTIKPWKPTVKYEAPNGQTVLGAYNHGTETFLFADTTIPVGLGLPKLTDEEVDALIAKADYAATAQAITTLADAVNYFHRAGIVFDDAPFPLAPNYGKSAWQVLKDNSGQCWTMSNLIHYLLKEDYEEVGYIHARTPGDGHVMIYIYHNGRYYLVNSVDYCVDMWRSSWFGTYPSELIVCADDFQVIADSLTEYMQLGDRKLVNFVHLMKSPGDFVMGVDYDQVAAYPAGTEVIAYYSPEFFYHESRIDWQSQTRIDN